MTSENSVVEKLIADPDSFASHIFRYCLSDKPPISLTSVINQKLYPIEYAARLSNLVGDEIIDRFYTNIAGVPKISNKIQNLWVYDTLVGIAAFYRLAEIFPQNKDRQQTLFESVNVYLLHTYDKQYPISALGGLTSYVAHARAFIRNNPERFPGSDGVYLTRTLNYVSTMDSPVWLLWDKKWHSLLTRTNWAITFRRFLYSVFCCFLQSPDNVEASFGVDKDDILTLAYDFVELRKSSYTTKADVDSFLKRIQSYFEYVLENPGYSLMLEAPFEIASFYYQECRGNPMRYQQIMSQGFHSI